MPVEPGRSLPRGIAAPASRALTAAGYVPWDDPIGMSAKHPLVALHGVGPRPSGCCGRNWPSLGTS